VSWIHGGGLGAWVCRSCERGPCERPSRERFSRVGSCLLCGEFCTRAGCGRSSQSNFGCDQRCIFELF